MNGFNFFLADQIHDGFRFLKEKTVLVFQKDGRFERVVSLDEIEKNEVKTFRGILCPGFVNAHCHLELSYLRGKIKEGGGLHEFIKEVEKQKQNSEFFEGASWNLRYHVHNEFTNAIKSSRSALLKPANTSREAFASPPCQRTASNTLRARPSCKR